MKREENITLIAEALSHPMRREMINRFWISDTALSPKLLSVSLGELLPLVSYHVHQLEQKQILTLVDTEPARGAIEHFYELTRLGRRAKLTMDLLDDVLALTEARIADMVSIEFVTVGSQE